MSTPALATRPNGAIRGRRERAIQTLSFEALGLLIVSPLFAQFTVSRTGETLLVLMTLSIAVMCWSALYNTAFDLIEYRARGRMASDRSHGVRVLHSVGHEASAAIVTWPLIVTLTTLGWVDALVADLGLTLTYAIYGYIFHLGFDRLRPVLPAIEDSRA